jgi:hypothetical protein
LAAESQVGSVEPEWQQRVRLAAQSRIGCQTQVGSFANHLNCSLFLDPQTILAFPFFIFSILLLRFCGDIFSSVVAEHFSVIMLI